MKGGSREAKGLKSTGGRRTWYGKRETLTPVSLLTELVSQNSQWLIFVYSLQIITKGRNSRHYLPVIYTRPHKLRSFDFHHVKARVNYLSQSIFLHPLPPRRCHRPLLPLYPGVQSFYTHGSFVLKFRRFVPSLCLFVPDPLVDSHLFQPVPASVAIKA